MRCLRLSGRAILSLGALLIATSSGAVPSLKGEMLYGEYCSECHGMRGDGRGPSAVYHSPRPANFKAGNFKFRSTDVGDYPASIDIFRTITDGRPGVSGDGMPSFDHLSEDERWELVSVVRYLAKIQEEPALVEVPPHPGMTDLALGEALYRENYCTDCHGETGRGDGLRADELVDDSGQPIRPANFVAGSFKGGDAPEDIWRRIYTGLDGTPMPTFGLSLTSDEIWALVDYVQSLGPRSE